MELIKKAAIFLDYENLYPKLDEAILVLIKGQDIFFITGRPSRS